ncbi:flagellar hook-length control protein FliK [Buttiauxella sp. WJP83]|uniref:flagellar hook-length control protein FliK n=1 Tax=Buttiauxella sp. WJP83 TaxID=2986951 RepID=UPI0022DDB2C3|nr:flagellar hook-length control protein FliK [Buttiauxella sp. WJP83]WBM72162.1 flagellar hook-length control protein FliK [Buttiauxella sp. WJP83]
MMTQPLMITSTDGVSSSTSGSKTAADKGFSEDFLSLLGKALPGQVTLADGKTVSLEAALNKAAGKGTSTGDEKASLASLLDNLDTPEALSALLSDMKKASSDDKASQIEAQNDQTHPQSLADMQALSALFAMLPQQTPTASTLNLQPKTDGDSANTLNALLTGSGIKNTLSPDARDTSSVLDKTAGLDKSLAAKNVSSTSNEPLAETKTFASLNNADNGSRDGAANNTTPASTVTTPVFSTATVATPASTQIAVPVAPQISAQLGSQEWQQAVSQHITMFTRQGQQTAELRLHPEDLGQIQISMKLDDNQAQLQMVSAHSHVRAALEATLPNLRIALAESGIELGQSSISSESFAQQQQQSGQQQQQTQRSSGSFPSLGESESLAVPASIQRLASGNNAVDIFA